MIVPRVVLLLALAACARGQRPAVALSGATCGPAQGLRISPEMPVDLVASRDGNVLARSADLFAWQVMIAASWPAGDGRLEWETWKEERELFRDDGAAPAGVPDACEGVARTLVRAKKIADVLDADHQAASATATLEPILTDQRGGTVRYEIRFNPIAEGHIVRGRLDDARVQAAAPAIRFPDGAVTLKAAWRPVAAEEEERFHVIDACVCEPGDGALAGCRRARMGLVGLHLAVKTPSAPAWIWSTFEHIDNVPGPGAGPRLSFHDPSCAGCVANAQTPPGTPTQLARTTPVASRAPDCAAPDAAVDDVATLNADVARAMTRAGSFLRFYQLVGTQRPAPRAAGQPPTVFSVTPPVLANTTMESFVQETSSCMGCHASARTARAGAAVSADFVFSLNNARPRAPDPDVVLPPRAPLPGLDLASRTYERLPDHVGAKLHCTSCHLDGGGNARAAWWVNLRKTYATPAELQARINHCFTNSLNGVALCAPGPDCDGNAAMRAFLEYMDWLAEARRGATAAGLPKIAALEGEARRGAAIFTQKCAVCHGADGAGRYAGGVYHRPALWGPASFNRAAGMFTSPAMLASFIRWNMPRGSGGVLTDQEAWDLAAFIDGQDRPGRR
jgi:mono/diheme cytochrome c family protein